MNITDEINIAIAETQGWCRIQWDENAESNGYSPVGTFREPIPNYHGSLDAIVPVVRTMDEQIKFRDNLLTIAAGLSSWADFDFGLDLWRMLTATPAQLCEAYLKSKGLWK